MKVNYIPTREQIEWVAVLAEQQKFGQKAGNPLAFVLHFRNGPYGEWLNTKSNTNQWFAFMPMRDDSGRELHISYQYLKLIDRRSSETSYYINLRWLNIDKSCWIVERVLEIIHNPELYQEQALKIAAWRKYRDMKKETTTNILQKIATDFGGRCWDIDFPNYQILDYGEQKKIMIRIECQGINFSFTFAEKSIPQFVNTLPSIITEAIELKKIKKGRCNTYPSVTYSQGMKIA